MSNLPGFGYIIKTGVFLSVGLVIGLLLIGLVVVLCPLLLVVALAVIGPALSAFGNIMAAIQ